MTSKTARDCFVYLTLPGETESITAGKFVLDSVKDGSPIGRFVYGRRYLARPNAVSIDPIELVLSGETYETARLGGLFGAIRDSSPDFWGRRLIERHLGKSLGEMDYLLNSPDDRAGALGFGLNVEPPAPARDFNKTISLEKLQHIANALLSDDLSNVDSDTIRIQQLIELGTSLGGARPKTVVEDDEGLWIAKLNRPDDLYNNPRVEHAMLQLARNCGINAAQSKIITVGSMDVLLVKRFDREKHASGYTRSRMISGLTVLRADDGAMDRENWSYLILAEQLRRIVAKPTNDANELFKRMCFNALISNLDDHPRNHAVIAKNEDWSLAPAYDLTPSRSVSLEKRELAMQIGDLNRHASRENILSQHGRFLLNRTEAVHLVDQMTEMVRSTWYNVCRNCGVQDKDANFLQSAFAYEGFFKPAPSEV